MNEKRVCSSQNLCDPLLGGDLSQVDDALAVSPLVVVPGNNLDHVVTHDHGQGSINGGGNISAAEVDGDEGLVGDGKDSLLGTVGSLAEGIVDLLSEGLLLDLDDEIDDGDVGGGDAQGNSVELALHGGQDQGNSLGGTGGGGDNVQASSAGAAQIPVGSVQQALVSGVGVGGGHGSLDDSELLLEDLN